MSSSRNRGGRKRDNKKQKTSIKAKSNAKKDDQSIWNKAWKGIGENEWIREDVASIIYWIRQILSLLIGMMWGLIKLEGILAALLYFVVCIFTLHAYKSQWAVPDEVFDIFDALKEGFVPALGLFLMGWVCTYSLVHYD